MKHYLFVLISIILILPTMAYADSYNANFTATPLYGVSGSSSNLVVTGLKYDPYPVNPGDYFTLWIKVENMGNGPTSNTKFELVPKFPFSIDNNENAVREIGSLPVEEPLVLEYKIRVSENAVEGVNEIEFKYNENEKSGSWVSQKYNITVDDAQTDFDLVIQETNEDETSIAIANTGKNIAYSVIVRIPEQEAYKTSGTDGQMVGNLENGDYTLVGFNIVSNKKNSDDKLEIQIDYTDNIGERRRVTKLVNLDVAESNTNSTMMGAKALQSSSQTPVYKEWWFWGALIVGLIVLNEVIKYYRRIREEREETNRKR